MNWWKGNKLATESAIFFQGLVFLLLFHIIGHPIVNSFLKRPGVPAKLTNLDSIQRLPLEFVMGGAVVYMVALVLTPFHGFTAVACWAITGIAVVAYLYQHLKKTAVFRSPSNYSWVALFGFVIALAIRVGPISNFVLGSNQDTSWHTLLVYSIVRNAGIPFSVIEGFVLQVPVGVHTNLAYFSLVSGIPVELIAFNSTIFFGALIGLAAYLFGSIISTQRFGLYVSLIMITFSYYPSAITWGSDWLLFGLLIFFVALTLLVTFNAENMKLNRSGLLNSLFPAIVTGFLFSVYIPLYVILVIVSIFFFLLSRKDVMSQFKKLAAILILGFPLFAIWVYRYFFLSQPLSPYLAKQTAEMMANQATASSAFFLPMQNLYSPVVILRTLGNWLTWDSQNGWLGAYFFFPLLSIGCILLLFYFLNHKIRGLDRLGPRYMVSIFLMTILWGLNGPLGLFNFGDFGLGIMISELDKIAPIIGTILLPFVAAFALASIHRFLSKRTKTRNWISAGVIIFVLLGCIVVATFPRIDDQDPQKPPIVMGTKEWLLGSYNVFATATESDYELLKWMKTGIPADSTVLVHPYDAGQYVPSIAAKKTVGIASTGVLFINQEYEDLNYHIRNNVMNHVTISLFRELGINYVFVGGNPFKERWNDQYFLDLPGGLFFTPVRSLVSNIKINNSYVNSTLFAVKIPDSGLGAGIIDNCYYTGFSDGKTLLDLKHMALYNLETGEGVCIEIGLRNQADDTLEQIGFWNQSQSVTITSEPFQERNARFTIAGLKHSFECLVSSNADGGMNVHFSVENAPRQSLFYLSYQPIYDVWQSNVHYTTDNATRWANTLSPIQGVRPEGNTFFQIIPKNDVIQSIYGGWEHGCLTVVSNTSTFDAIIQTLPT